jgi:ABC-2 type transport system ATP-binding protein
MSEAAARSTVPVLRISDLSAGYGARPVLRAVNIEVDLGQWYVLLGPNGSGKSTLLYCVAGLLQPRAGRIELGGVSLATDVRNAKRILGFACAPERLPGLLTGRQCLEVYAAAKGVRTIDAEVLELAERFDCTALLDQYVDTYSLGTRQKLAVLQALIGAPRLIVLDEAFNGLDPASAAGLKRHLRARVEAGHSAVLLATHALDVVERHADQVGLMISGRLVQAWSAAQLAALRAAGESLEETLARAAAQVP